MTIKNEYSVIKKRKKRKKNNTDFISGLLVLFLIGHYLQFKKIRRNVKKKK